MSFLVFFSFWQSMNDPFCLYSRRSRSTYLQLKKSAPLYRKLPTPEELEAEKRRKEKLKQERAAVKLQAAARRFTVRRHHPEVTKRKPDSSGGNAPQSFLSMAIGSGPDSTSAEPSDVEGAAPVRESANNEAAPASAGDGDNEEEGGGGGFHPGYYDDEGRYLYYQQDEYGNDYFGYYDADGTYVYCEGDRSKVWTPEMLQEKGVMTARPETSRVTARGEAAGAMASGRRLASTESLDPSAAAASKPASSRGDRNDTNGGSNEVLNSAGASPLTKGNGGSRDRLMREQAEGEADGGAAASTGDSAAGSGEPPLRVVSLKNYTPSAAGKVGSVSKRDQPDEFGIEDYVSDVSGECFYDECSV